MEYWILPCSFDHAAKYGFIRSSKCLLYLIDSCSDWDKKIKMFYFKSFLVICGSCQRIDKLFNVFLFKRLKFFWILCIAKLWCVLCSVLEHLNAQKILIVIISWQWYAKKILLKGPGLHSSYNLQLEPF
jgi:hypothetical protein